MKIFSLLRCALLSLALLPSFATAATVSALGRVLPRSGIIDLYGVTGDTIQAINVHEGDWVEPGQSLATLSSAASARSRLQSAEADLADTRLSTARDLQIAADQVATSELELKYAINRQDRIMSAGNSEFISPDQIESRALGKQQSELKLAQAKQDLSRARTDARHAIRAAETEVGAARAARAAAEAQAPIAGRILKIRGRVGNQLNGRTEILKLGDTRGMNVVAEVYESEILKVKPGQKAVITSPALPAPMSGVVTGVSPIVFRNTIESMDPNASTQARVVEVVISMDQAEPLDRLVFLQVNVTIDL
ncbi:MAG: efflux RND transporter periplasmic adaptor subunit [Opitutaceae bacterium]|nr:efflux RND transporter periplasmic adaptor subunit [Opitutaceae bacterium]